MELVNGGSLWDFMKTRRTLDEKLARWLFQQLVLAVDYCHAKVRGWQGFCMLLDVLSPPLSAAFASCQLAACAAFNSSCKHPHTPLCRPTQDVRHRDIKLENILLTTSADSPILKICDFG